MHTATGNKTVTYDFAPIISQEGCLYFTLEQRKEAKTIKLSRRAERGLHVARPRVPLVSAESAGPAKPPGPTRDRDPHAYFGPSQSQGRNRRDVNHPKASPSLFLHKRNMIFHAEPMDVFPAPRISTVKFRCLEGVYQFWWLWSKIIRVSNF